ncbi:DUF1706 domain-containing protein [Streptococcus pneumoniae]|nr:DUF1706 domain-containing protein [Streptococcus pneumoniae]
MRTYENKEELKAEIEKTFEKYILEFDNIPENLKEKIRELMKLTELQQKTLLIRLVGPTWFLNGKKMKERGFK